MGNTTVILNPAAVDDFPRNVFCIGPYGDKVSFSSQQKRALNVVWALGEDAIVTAGTNVAVVGGGLAGLMACSALKGLGCYVTLYELNEDVLERQLSARHRTVHPSINAWPLIDYPRSTTDYPFFDWHVGECAEIINALKRDWDKHGNRYVVAFNNFSAVQKIEKDGGDPSRVKLLYKNLNPETRSAIDEENIHTETPDVIVVTTGFGEETIFTSANVQSYWLPDTVNMVRKKSTSIRISLYQGRATAA